jgi:CRISPR/Cas system-associated exonuclease Cas4 (RecB family)
MKRQLTETEKELTLKGIEKNKEQLINLNNSLEIMQLHKEFLIKKRAYEDKVRPFNREKEDLEIENSIVGYNAEIKLKEDIIKELNNQLNEGVEMKENSDMPTGVG